MKTKALISFAFTEKLICIFVLAYADCWFSHVAAHLFGSIHLSNAKYSFANFTGPEVIKVFSCSAQLSLKFKLLINAKVAQII